MAEDYRTFGDKLFALRRERGWTQGVLAEITGLSIGAIRQFEQGTRFPTVETLLRLCLAFSSTVDEMLDDVKIPRRLKTSVYRKVDRL